MHTFVEVIISFKQNKLPKTSLSSSAPGSLCPTLLLLSTTNHPVYHGPPATADSANAAIWVGTESTTDFSLALNPQMLS